VQGAPWAYPVLALLCRTGVLGVYDGRHGKVKTE
jgi:hypothetical protein